MTAQGIGRTEENVERTTAVAWNYLQRGEQHQEEMSSRSEGLFLFDKGFDTGK